ncbi:hypothetical protein LTR84_006555 [Exophiala bonariae]|uniref:FAD-binding PCMH-type domain-containing protein n=1 Tax=Exophiala bonariae TaxID=1690606 RepID=A0AAV9N0G1_9EURO|nr:hypothetical protein LTR84_006555 [Exophiala bonariae]
MNEAIACSLLSTIRPSLTLLPDEPEYERAKAAFWSSTQTKSTPAAIFQPRMAADVSIAIIILKKTSCRFAVKSGGHGKWAGESSINGGVLIDLANMKQIKLSQKQSVVALGPGNRWGDVYSALEPLGLTVVGGRASGVGVGGFLLGGGISWYSNLYGWGCDNIEAYEVVLADGSVVTASEDVFPDLYKALRGGTGNFGIVTAFFVKLYPYTGMWGGTKTFKRQYSDQATKGFIDIGSISDSVDPKSFFILSLSTTEDKSWVWGSSLIYCDTNVNLACFNAVETIPTLNNECRVRDQTESVAHLQSYYPNWMQYSIWTMATKVDLITLRICCAIWEEEMDPLLHEVGDLVPVLAIQYITSKVIEGAGRSGGNVTGLAGTQPFVMYNSEPRWAHAHDNQRVISHIKRAFERMSTESRRLGTNHEYRYSNYASEYQDAIVSYGTDSNEFLRKVSNKYDPNGVFQKLRSSGFDFSGPPRKIQELEYGAKL